MRLLWHIAAKDLRRLWLPLALWGLVVLARNEMGVVLLRGDGSTFATFDLLQTCASLLLGLDTFIHVILAIVLVQEDATVGTRMFWMTRPVSGLRLLGAKLLGALLMFGLLPVLLSLRWWLVCGYGAGEIAHAAMITLDGQMALTLVVMVFAALTENLRQFLGLSLVVLAAAGALFTGLFTSRTFIGVGFPTVRMAMSVSTIVLLSGLAATFVHQYRTRRTRRSLSLVVVFFVAATLALPLWRWNWWRDEYGTTRPEAAALTVEVGKATAQFPPPPPPGWGTMRLEFLLQGLPEDVVVNGQVQSIVQWPAGGRSPRHPPIETFSLDGAVKRALNIAPLSSGATKREAERVRVPLFLSERDLIRLRTEKVAFSSWLTLDLSRPVQELALPLTPGPGAENHGYTVRVTQSRTSDGVMHVRLVESRPIDLGMAYGRPGFIWLLGLRQTKTRIAHRVVSRMNQDEGQVEPGGMQSIIGTQVVRWSGLSLEHAGQFEGATLRLLRYEPLGRISRTVVAESLPVTFSN